MQIYGYTARGCNICGEFTYQITDPLPTLGRWESDAAGWKYVLDNPEEVWSETPYFADCAAYCDNGVWY